tara:strand:+ start:2660 stop:4459 length:1800 start_codon:yes stop_codon:yes gene_type:complete
MSEAKLNEISERLRTLNESFGDLSTGVTEALTGHNEFSQSVGERMSETTQAVQKMDKGFLSGFVGKLKDSLSFLKPSMESIKEEKRANDAFFDAIGNFSKATGDFFKRGADKVKEKFSFLGPIGTLLKGLIIGGALFLLLKKLPEIFNSDLYKQMIITIEKHIVPGIKKLYNDYLKPFFMFFVDGLSALFKDINDDSKSAGDVIKENGKFLLASLGALALYMYPSALFKTIAFAGKNLVLAGRLLGKTITSTGKAMLDSRVGKAITGKLVDAGKAMGSAIVNAGKSLLNNAASLAKSALAGLAKGASAMGAAIVNAGKALLSNALSVGRTALAGLASGAVAMKGALVSAGIALKAAAAPLLAALIPFTPIILAVAAGILLAKTAFESVAEKWNETPGVIGKIKLIVASILAAPINFFKGIISWVAGKLGFENAAKAIDAFDPVQGIIDFFSSVGTFIADKFRALKDKLFSLGTGILDFFRGKKTLEEGADTSGQTVANKIEKRQSGGPVKKDSLYLVGEKGPELFSPSMSGIVANSQRTADITNRAMENAMAAMKGVGQSVQNIISAPTQNVENKTENKVAIGVGTLDDNFRQLATFSF